MNGDVQIKLLPPSPAVTKTPDRVTPKTIQPSKPEFAISASASVTVQLRPQWVWHRLNDPCNWAEFLGHLSSVTKSSFDMDEYTWSVGNQHCPIRLTVREPPLHLAWQSLAGQPLQLSGEIILEPLEWYTQLTIRLHYLTDDPQLNASLQVLEAELQRDMTAMAQVLGKSS